jgi:hypothetical protein
MTTIFGEAIERKRIMLRCALVTGLDPEKSESLERFAVLFSRREELLPTAAVKNRDGVIDAEDIVHDVAEWLLPLEEESASVFKPFAGPLEKHLDFIGVPRYQLDDSFRESVLKERNDLREKIVQVFNVTDYGAKKESVMVRHFIDSFICTSYTGTGISVVWGKEKLDLAQRSAIACFDILTRTHSAHHLNPEVREVF